MLALCWTAGISLWAQMICWTWVLEEESSRCVSAETRTEPSSDSAPAGVCFTLNEDEWSFIDAMIQRNSSGGETCLCGFWFPSVLPVVHTAWKSGSCEYYQYAQIRLECVFKSGDLTTLNALEMDYFNMRSIFIAVLFYYIDILVFLYFKVDHIFCFHFR